MFKKTTFIISILGASTLLYCCNSGNNSPKNNNSTPPNAATLYNTYCAACHGNNGALGFSGAANLATSTLTPAQAAQVIANGKGAMVGFKTSISEKDIILISEYIQGFKTTN